MTYEEAQQKALTVEWITSICNQGESCWCRVIEPKEPIIWGQNNEEYYIVSSGSIPQLEAEHLVELHNKNL